MNKFWGIDFQSHSKEETLRIIERHLVKSVIKKPLIITTLNPEILLFADGDEQYRDILNKFNLKNVDGFGIKLMGWFRRKNTSRRIPGADLARHILKVSVKKKLKIAFVFKKDGLSQKKDLQKFSKNFRADIKFIEYDVMGEKDNQKINSEIKDREVVLVGIGAPHQERFIDENKKNWPNLKLAIGVGGTFDFWTGNQSRAPRIMRKIGLEWLWRLITRPKRIWKIWKSTVVFMVKSLSR